MGLLFPLDVFFSMHSLFKYIACVSGDGVANLISLNNLCRFDRSF